MDQLVAFVMPENVWSGRVLLRNGFVKEQRTEERHNWGGHETVTVKVYTAKEYEITPTVIEYPMIVGVLSAVSVMEACGDKRFFFRQAVFFLAQRDALHQESHVAAERAHGLQVHSR